MAFDLNNLLKDLPTAAPSGERSPLRQGLADLLFGQALASAEAQFRAARKAFRTAAGEYPQWTEMFERMQERLTGLIADCRELADAADADDTQS